MYLLTCLVICLLTLTCSLAYLLSHLLVLTYWQAHAKAMDALRRCVRMEKHTHVLAECHYTLAMLLHTNFLEAELITEVDLDAAHQAFHRAMQLQPERAEFELMERQVREKRGAKPFHEKR